ncbi:6804_t:CDS:1, partial [Gigaspora rosea]
KRSRPYSRALFSGNWYYPEIQRQSFFSIDLIFLKTFDIFAVKEG